MVHEHLDATAVTQFTDWLCLVLIISWSKIPIWMVLFNIFNLLRKLFSGYSISLNHHKKKLKRNRHLNITDSFFELVYRNQSTFCWHPNLLRSTLMCWVNILQAMEHTVFHSLEDSIFCLLFISKMMTNCSYFLGYFPSVTLQKFLPTLQRVGVNLWTCFRSRSCLTELYLKAEKELFH